jgi:hypothetical protein
MPAVPQICSVVVETCQYWPGPLHRTQGIYQRPISYVRYVLPHNRIIDARRIRLKERRSGWEVCGRDVDGTMPRKCIEWRKLGNGNGKRRQLSRQATQYPHSSHHRHRLPSARSKPRVHAYTTFSAIVASKSLPTPTSKPKWHAASSDNSGGLVVGSNRQTQSQPAIPSCRRIMRTSAAVDSTLSGLRPLRSLNTGRIGNNSSPGSHTNIWLTSLSQSGLCEWISRNFAKSERKKACCGYGNRFDRPLSTAADAALTARYAYNMARSNPQERL